MSPLRLALIVPLLCLAAPARARVLDPTAVNTFDLRLDAGLATPVGALGGAMSAPFRYFAIEAAGGVGLTGVNLSVVAEIIQVRWGRNQLLVGLAGTVALPLTGAPMARKRTYWLTGEVAFQRTLFIDNILYLGLGITRGSYYNQCLNEGNTMCGIENKALWPEVRIGYGRRY